MYYATLHLHIRQRLNRFWWTVRFRVFMTLGTQMFGCVATWAPDGNIKVVHFAKSRHDLHLSAHALSVCANRADKIY
jgi:hypothetical protein